MMSVLLVGPEFEENLSLRYLASSLQSAGHRWAMARFDSREYLDGVVDQALREKPDIIGLSMVFQVRAREFFELARMLRSSGYRGHITAGGHFATFAYEDVLRDVPEIDSIIRQEGEQTLVELADALAAGAPESDLGRIPGLVLRRADGTLGVAERRQQVADLDRLPHPARSDSPELHLGVPTSFLVGSRGCYADCDYCSIFAWHEAAFGKRYRMRNVANIADEMAGLYRRLGTRFFVFHDDNFFLPTAAANLKRFRALRAEIEARGMTGIGLMLKLRPNDCDPEVMAELKAMGLTRAFVGIENASQRQIRSLGRDSTVEDVNACLRMLRDLEVYTTFNILLFDPYTTLDDVQENIAFLRENSFFPFNWCKVEPYAGTALQQRYAREGRLQGTYLGHDYTMEEPRTRLAYDLLLPAFHFRNFGYYGLANLNIGLGYHLQLLKHFYPDRCSLAIRSEADDVIRAINLDTLDLLQRTVDFARSTSLSDERGISLFREQLKRDSYAAQHQLSERVESVVSSIEAAAGVSASAYAGRSEAFTPLTPQPVPSPRVRTSIRLLPRRDCHRLAALMGGAAVASLLFVAPGCSRPPANPPVAASNPAAWPDSPPHGTIAVAPGQAPSVEKGASFRLRGILEPEGAQVIGEPRVTCKGGRVKTVKSTADKRVLEIDYHPGDNTPYEAPNATVTVSWMVRGKESDVAVMAQAFVHSNEDGTYAFGYRTPRPTIAEMAAPPISTGPNPGGGAP